MQSKTFCALVCTFVVLLIQTNEGAPTTAKPATTTKGAATTKGVTIKTAAPVLKIDEKPKILPGARTIWSTKLNPVSKKIFNDYKKIIAKKLQATHKLPATFVPKVDKFATQVVSGSLYHYLIKTPGNKYAHVTVLHKGWKKDLYGKEENVTVRPKLSELNETSF